MGILSGSSKKSKQQTQSTETTTKDPQSTESLEALVRRVVRAEVELALNPPKPQPPPKPEPEPFPPQPVVGVAFQDVSPTESVFFSVVIEDGRISVRELLQGHAIPVHRRMDALKQMTRGLAFGARHSGREAKPNGKLTAVAFQRIAPEVSRASIIEIEGEQIRIVETAEPTGVSGHASALAQLSEKAALPPEFYELRRPLVA